MFLGTYTPKLDDKGRFFLPSKFRADLNEGLVITRGQDHCLVIYPQETFLAMTKDTAAAPTTIQNVRAYQRMIASSASADTPDKQGRIVIPPQLRKYADLDNEIVVIGSLDRVEVWNPQAWEEYSAKQEEIFAALDEEVFPIS